VNVFISYRRSDSQDLAGRIADHLETVDEIDRVFIDVRGIARGEEFEAITDAILVRSDVCMVLIGSNWQGPRDSGKPRIFDDADFVRGEVRLALNKDIRLLPVLVNGATMPAADSLPDDIARLPKINAAPLDHVSFDQDIDALVSTMIRDPDYRRARPFWRRAIRTGLRSLLGAVIGLAGFLLIALLSRAYTDQALDKTAGNLAGLLALGTICAVAGAFYPWWRRRK